MMNMIGIKTANKPKPLKAAIPINSKVVTNGSNSPISHKV